MSRSENEDMDNLRIADSVMSYSRFPSESEDEDNMRRCRAASVPLNTPGLPWNRSSSLSKPLGAKSAETHTFVPRR